MQNKNMFNTNTTTTPYQEGFSLIELMIVVAIIGVLAAVAYPSYVEQVRQANRADAATNVLECASILERRFTVTNTYTDDACTNLIDQNDKYTFAIDLQAGTNGCVRSGRNNCYTITATPTGSMADDARCESMSYSHLGLKTATGNTNDSVGVCWRDT